MTDKDLGSAPPAERVTPLSKAIHGRRWTRPAIKRAVCDYSIQFDRPPTAEEWMRPGEWPNYKTVRRIFGSWANAIEASTGQRPRRGIYVATSRCQPRGPYKNGIYKPRSPSRWPRILSLDAPLRSAPNLSLHDVLSAHDDWEDWILEQIDQRREIDALEYVQRVMMSQSVGRSPTRVSRPPSLLERQERWDMDTVRSYSSHYYDLVAEAAA